MRLLSRGWEWKGESNHRMKKRASCGERNFGPRGRSGKGGGEIGQNNKQQQNRSDSNYVKYVA